MALPNFSEEQTAKIEKFAPKDDPKSFDSVEDFNKLSCEDRKAFLEALNSLTPWVTGEIKKGNVIQPDGSVDIMKPLLALPEKEKNKLLSSFVTISELGEKHGFDETSPPNFFMFSLQGKLQLENCAAR